MRRFASVLLLALLAPIVAASDVSERLADYFQYCADQQMFNGAVLVRDDGETVYAAAFGSADPRTGRALDADSAFYLASVSKPFTSMAAMVLAEAEVLSLDDRLVDHFPEFAGFADDVRIHHLMTHTSGLPDHYRLLGSVPDGLDNERVRSVLVEHGQLDFEPGTDFRYSNGGYVMLSMVVASAAGKSYREVLAERVLAPLGMERTVVYDETEPTVENRAHGFRTGGVLDDYTLYTTGAGGMYSTVADLALWDAGLHDGKLVSAEMLARAYTPPTLANGERSDYGFGWSVETQGGHTVVAHAGGLAAFATYVIRDLDEQDTLIILSNQGDALADFGELSRGVAAILGGDEPKLPPIPIGPLVRRLVDGQGVDAALARYAEIWNGEAERYDLSEGHLNEVGYSYLQAGQVDIALALFERNTESYPRAFNTWDSLAEAQLAKGREADAIANYSRSLELNPDNRNAAEILAKLEANDG